MVDDERVRFFLLNACIHDSSEPMSGQGDIL